MSDSGKPIIPIGVNFVALLVACQPHLAYKIHTDVGDIDNL